MENKVCVTGMIQRIEQKETNVGDGYYEVVITTMQSEDTKDLRLREDVVINQVQKID